MTYYWTKCDVCDAKGTIEIGNRFQKLFKLKIQKETCPKCKGQGSVPRDPYPLQPFKRKEIK